MAGVTGATPSREHLETAHRAAREAAREAPRGAADEAAPQAAHETALQAADEAAPQAAHEAAHGSVTAKSHLRPAVGALLIGLALLAGCGPTAPVSPIIVSFPPSSIEPTPTPTKNPALAAVAAFVDRVSSDDFSYTATLRGQSRHSVTILPVKGSLAVSGSDYALVASFTFPDERVTAKVEQRFVRRVGWIRYHPERWQRLKAFGEDDVLSPFAGVLTASDVTLLETLKGPTYRVRISGLLLHPSLIPAFNVSEEDVQRARFDVMIDQDGRPLSGTWELTGSARVSGQLQEVVMELSVKFANVGEKVTVRAP